MPVARETAVVGKKVALEETVMARPVARLVAISESTPTGKPFVFFVRAVLTAASSDDEGDELFAGTYSQALHPGTAL